MITQNKIFKYAYKKTMLLSIILSFSNLIFISSWSMDPHQRQITQSSSTPVTCSQNLLLKSLYIGSCILSIGYVAYTSALSTIEDAESRHHNDPESKGAAIFLATSLTGGCISHFCYNLLFNTKTQPATQNNSNRQKKIRHKKNIGWVKQKKIKGKVPYRKQARN